MPLTEANEFTSASVGEFGHIAVRIDRVIYRDEDGKKAEVSRLPHRHVLSPGDDLKNEHPRVQAIANGAWGKDVLAQYAAIKAELVAQQEG